jgi:hypothetical protein
MDNLLGLADQALDPLAHISRITSQVHSHITLASPGVASAGQCWLP